MRACCGTLGVGANSCGLEREGFEGGFIYSKTRCFDAEKKKNNQTVRFGVKKKTSLLPQLSKIVLEYIKDF